MKIKQVGSNMTELEFSDGLILLFSYETPVACKVPSASHVGEYNYYVTDKKWSRTTSKHITQWTHGGPSQMNPQKFFDSLVEETGNNHA